MIACLILASLAWVALEARLSPHEPARPPRRDNAAALATGAALLAVQASAIAEHALAPTAACPAGLAVLCAGVTLRLAAIRALGRDFVSATIAPRHLRTAGLYCWMRHPSELGLLLAAAGTALATQSPIAASLTAITLVPLSLLRTRAEDRLLAPLRLRG